MDLVNANGDTVVLSGEGKLLCLSAQIRTFSMSGLSCVGSLQYTFNLISLTVSASQDSPKMPRLNLCTTKKCKFCLKPCDQVCWPSFDTCVHHIATSRFRVQWMPERLRC